MRGRGGVLLLKRQYWSKNLVMTYSQIYLFFRETFRTVGSGLPRPSPKTSYIALTLCDPLAPVSLTAT